MTFRQLCFLIAATVFAFFPVIRWYVYRLGDGGGEALGLIPLAIAVVFAVRERREPHPAAAWISLILYVVIFSFVPPLIRAVPALMTVAFLLGIHRHAGLTGLLFLSLPIQASFDFFLGYPFRVITAEGSRFILDGIGLPVTRVGVQLAIKDTIVAVDAPCSGLQMLWVTGLLTGVLALFFRLTWTRTVFLGFAALILCLLGNTIRATLLFFPESGRLVLPDVAHVGVGALIFLGVASLLFMVARCWQGRRAPAKSIFLSGKFFPVGALLGGMCVCYAPEYSLPVSTSVPALTHYRGQPVEPLALSSFEESFAKTFPGQFNLYRVGNKTLIVRHVTRATRRLHPSSHCLQGEGFHLGTAAISYDEEGQRWLSYEATRFQEKLLVAERITSLTTGQEWGTISAWYWHALFHPQVGPWQSQTLITPIL